MVAPRHQALAETLLARIADGTFPVGSRLPTEEQLCASHGMARETVRRALRRLEDLGMISRRQGSGTTVLASRPVAGYQPLARSAADIVALAADTKIVDAWSGDTMLDDEAAGRLGAAVGSVWFAVRGPRVRRDTGATICWSEHYLRSDLPREKILRFSFRAEDVADGEVEQVISAALVTERMALALGVAPATAALVITRRHYGRDGRLASVGIHSHPADRYQIATRL